MDIIDKIKNLLNSSENNKDAKNSKLMRNIVILGMVGTLLLLFGNVFVTDNMNSDSKVSTTKNVTTVEKNEISYENKVAKELEGILSVMKGVGKVKVKIFTSNQVGYEYEYNTNETNKVTNETDTNGGKRTIDENTDETDMVIIKDASGNESPVVKNKNGPEIKGVMIVAEGAEISKIKYQIITSVSNLLDLPVFKINVLPYERG
ncbi:MAG: hypothetical protein ACOCRZ_03255 [Halothermotrichaceae bacterium]